MSVDLATEQNQASLIYFETPVNEAIRICLRLEQLFVRFHQNLPSDQNKNSSESLSALLQLMQLVDRRDLKTKLTHLTSQYATSLGQLEQFPQVDKEKLHDLLDQLDKAHDFFNQHNCQFYESLRSFDFLNQCRLRFNNPGGIYELPSFQNWQQQNAEKRKADCLNWYQCLSELDHIAHLLLRLARESGSKQKQKSQQGIAQLSLDSNCPCDLVRIGINPELGLYPDVSIGAHRLNIRFSASHFAPQQTTTQVDFEVIFCRV